MNDTIERLIQYILGHTSYVQRELLLQVHKGTFKVVPGDGISSASLQAMHDKALINRNDWKAEITWLGVLVALRLEAEDES